MGSFSRNAVIQGMNLRNPINPEEILENSPLSQLHRSDGAELEKLITITGTGAEVITNLFTVDCSTELKAIYGIFENVADVATLTNCYFDLWDGAVSVPLTLASGVNCSGATLGSLIQKAADATQAAIFNNANQARYTEDANFNRAFFGGVMTAKFGATTYIRFRATTGATTSCQIRFRVVWARRCVGARMEVAP